MRIFLFTAAGAYNLGDELLLLSEWRWLHDRFPDAWFTVATYAPDIPDAHLLPPGVVRFLSYFPNGLSRHPIANIGYFFAMVWAIARSDLVVVGGGGLFFDTESGVSWRRLMGEWWLRIIVARVFRVPVRYLSLGVSVSDTHILAFRPLFVGSRTRVSVRDRASIELLRGIGVDAMCLPDAAFLLGGRPDGEIFHQSRTVGISVRRGYLPDETRFLRTMVEYIRGLGYTPVFLSHSLHPNDSYANDATFVREIFPDGDITITMNLRETLDAYVHVRYVVGMRLHSMILSTLYAIPFLPIGYGSKTHEFLGSIEYPIGLEARDTTIESFEREFGRLVDTEERLVLDLHEKSVILGHTIRNGLTELFCDF